MLDTSENRTTKAYFWSWKVSVTIFTTITTIGAQHHYTLNRKCASNFSTIFHAVDTNYFMLRSSSRNFLKPTKAGSKFLFLQSADCFDFEVDFSKTFGFYSFVAENWETTETHIQAISVKCFSRLEIEITEHLAMNYKGDGAPRKWVPFNRICQKWKNIVNERMFLRYDESCVAERFHCDVSLLFCLQNDHHDSFEIFIILHNFSIFIRRHFFCSK